MNQREIGDRLYHRDSGARGSYKAEPEIIERVTATQAVTKSGTRLRREMQASFGGSGWYATEVGSEYGSAYWLESPEVLQEIKAQADRALVVATRFS